MTKRYIRKVSKLKRKMIPKGKKLFYDILILRRLKKILSTFSFEKIFVYINMKNEVDTRRIIDYLLAKKKEVYVPKIVDNYMIAVRLTRTSILKNNKYLIKEPVDEIRIAPDSIDICLIPLIAFDRNLNRIGFGKGYYDKFLKDVKSKCIKIGLAYHMQKVKRIISDMHDIRLDIVVTERGIIKGNNIKF